MKPSPPERHLSEALGHLMTAQRQLKHINENIPLAKQAKHFLGGCHGRLSQVRLDLLFLRESLNNEAAIESRQGAGGVAVAPKAPEATTAQPIDEAKVLSQMSELNRLKCIAEADLAVALRRVEELEVKLGLA